MYIIKKLIIPLGIRLSPNLLFIVLIYTICPLFLVSRHLLSSIQRYFAHFQYFLPRPRGNLRYFLSLLLLYLTRLSSSCCISVISNVYVYTTVLSVKKLSSRSVIKLREENVHTCFTVNRVSSTQHLIYSSMKSQQKENNVFIAFFINIEKIISILYYAITFCARTYLISSNRSPDLVYTGLVLNSSK